MSDELKTLPKIEFDIINLLEKKQIKKLIKSTQITKDDDYKLLFNKIFSLINPIKLDIIYEIYEYYKTEKTVLKIVLSTLQKKSPKNINEISEYDTSINKYIKEIDDLKYNIKHHMHLDYCGFVMSKIYFKLKNNCIINYEDALKTIKEIVNY